jgi:RNA polymerase sigma factor (sigma-70 family)
VSLPMAHDKPMSRPPTPSMADPPELAALVEQYGSGLRRYFYKKVPPAEVEDLVQTVFLNMHMRASEQPVESVERYLFRVAAHVLARRSRDTRFEPLDDAFEPAEDISPERILIGKQALARLSAALAELPPKTREAFILHRYEEMTYAAIGRRLGISVSGVEKLIIRALRNLRQAVEAQP